MDAAAQPQFQFLIGSLKMGHAQVRKRGGTGFQFLIGSLKILDDLFDRAAHFLFQFLIGSLKIWDKNRCFSGNSPCFNSS